MADETRMYEELIGAARQASNKGNRGEAERLLIEALVRGEYAFGAEHPSLGTVLNELGRLYIRQSQYEHAEEVLERLLRITRSKGEEHPDAATALAGLALVKRALGDDAAAEQLYRDALRIRERALAPQHMATVVTMEQLSETCAARGNVSEALALLQRALPTREAALGADHATVRSLRTRIAELELRALASNFAASAPRITTETPAVVPAADPTSAPAPSASIEAPSLAPARRPRRKRFLFFGFAGVSAVALATVGMTARSRAEAGSVGAASSPVSEAHAARKVSTPSTNAAAITATAGATLPDPAHESATGIVQAGTPMPDSVAPAAAPKLPRVPKNLALLTAKLVAGTNVDSMVRASTLDKNLSTEKLGAGVALGPSSHVDDAGAKPAVLIAPAPLPRFPAELRSHWSESEVVVRFRVDERGRVDVGSMKVLKSDHELFVAAVREVLPRFRFEPARSAAPESKPVADWVDFRVKFAATH
jgi:hypothetical protein